MRNSLRVPTAPAVAKFALVLAVSLSLFAVTRSQTIDCSGVPGIPFDYKASDKSVSLNFDDGPDCGLGTDAILDVLKAEGVKATFFINTNNLCDLAANSKGQDQVKRMISEGHEIGSHTASHARGASTTQGVGAFTKSGIKQELDGVEEVLAAIGTPKKLSLWRAPYGAPFQSGTQAEIDYVQSVTLGYAVHVGWSCDGKDYNIFDADTLYASYKQCIDDGLTGPILMHSTSYMGPGLNPSALEKIIQAYKAANYNFVLVEDYIQRIYGMSSDKVVEACGGRAASVTATTPPPSSNSSTPAPSSPSTSPSSPDLASNSSDTSNTTVPLPAVPASPNVTSSPPVVPVSSENISLVVGPVGDTSQKVVTAAQGPKANTNSTTNTTGGTGGTAVKSAASSTLVSVELLVLLHAALLGLTALLF